MASILSVKSEGKSSAEREKDGSEIRGLRAGERIER